MSDQSNRESSTAFPAYVDALIEDSARLAAPVFEAADWRWNTGVATEGSVPTRDEITARLRDLATTAIDNGKACSVSSGRLHFSVLMDDPPWVTYTIDLDLGRHDQEVCDV